eukprot:7770-Heterococcus_DN1.PRE.2
MSGTIACANSCDTISSCTLHDVLMLLYVCTVYVCSELALCTSEEGWQVTTHIQNRLEIAIECILSHVHCPRYQKLQICDTT